MLKLRSFYWFFFFPPDTWLIFAFPFLLFLFFVPQTNRSVFMERFGFYYLQCITCWCRRFRLQFTGASRNLFEFLDCSFSVLNICWPFSFFTSGEGNEVWGVLFFITDPCLLIVVFHSEEDYNTARWNAAYAESAHSNP